MSNARIYSRDEIRKILSRAAEIQAKRDTGEEGLTQDELLHVAHEVGIDDDALLQALHDYDRPGFDAGSGFDWLKGSSRVQHHAVLQGEISDELWEEFVHEIRRITGGIGKVSHNPRSYEWEQRKQEIGYTHISATPRQGKTKVQYVADWSALKIGTTLMATMMSAVFTMVALESATLSGPVFVLLAALGGAGGFGLSRVFLKSFFERQKARMRQIFEAFAARTRPGTLPESAVAAPTIALEDGFEDDRSLDHAGLASQRTRPSGVRS